MREPNAVDSFIRFNAQTKFFEPVWFRRDILPFWFYPDEQFVHGAITINAAGATTPPVVYKLPHASLDLDSGLGNPLKISQMVFEDSTDGTSLANWTIMMEDLGDKIKFMNAPIHIRTFAGGVQLNASGVPEMLPALLFEPMFLPTRHNLIFTFNKIAGGAVNVRLFPVGEIFYTWSPKLQQYPLDYRIMTELVNKHLERRKYVQPFWLTTENGGVSVPANQMVEADALIGDDGHFEASHILAVSDGAFEVEFFNPQTRQTMSNGTIHSAMIGDAFNPQPFSAAWVIPSGQTIRFRIRDLSGANNKVWITLRGRKLRGQFKTVSQVAKELGIPEPQSERQRVVPKKDTTMLQQQPDIGRPTAATQRVGV